MTYVRDKAEQVLKAFYPSFKNGEAEEVAAVIRSVIEDCAREAEKVHEDDSDDPAAYRIRALATPSPSPRAGAELEVPSVANVAAGGFPAVGRTGGSIPPTGATPSPTLREGPPREPACTACGDTRVILVYGEPDACASCWAKCDTCQWTGLMADLVPKMDARLCPACRSSAVVENLPTPPAAPTPEPPLVVADCKHGKPAGTCLDCDGVTLPTPESCATWCGGYRGNIADCFHEDMLKPARTGACYCTEACATAGRPLNPATPGKGTP